MIELALVVFAVYRAAELLAIDDGPGDVLLKFRMAAGAYTLGENGRPSSMGRLVSCPYCIGIYLAFVAAFIIAPLDWRLILYWLGIAGAQAFLECVGGRTP